MDYVRYLRISAICLFLFESVTGRAYGIDLGRWISPGELAGPHKTYEGIFNCIKCHILGRGISDAKCLDCHNELKKLITNRSGYHATISERCIKCHSDHKGRQYDILNLNKNEFVHSKTGYVLQGRHNTVKCDDCHKKHGTYLGAPKKCIRCHKDEHKGQLNTDCSECHNFDSWQEIINFVHDKDSSYILTGKHKAVLCKDCHIEKRYRPIDYKKCSNDICHIRDFHKGQFQTDSCQKCHAADSWENTDFTHSLPYYTNYVLNGKHKDVPCGKCHINDIYKPIRSDRCDTDRCHSRDIHKGQFSDKNCGDCHIESRWSPSTFSHNNPFYTDYRLIGRHSATACENCHSGGIYKDIPYKTCQSMLCHTNDTHEGQFDKTECILCHNENGWKPSLFDHNSADYKGYKLKGRHAETACSKCHHKGKYKGISYKRCDEGECHNRDIHDGQFGDDDCKTCHNVEGWKPSLFNHNSADYKGYKLKERHAETACSKCHHNGKYKGISYKRCDEGECHNRDIHDGQFGDDDCKTCHNVEGWKPSTFTHDNPEYEGFKLEGGHAKTECIRCHENGIYKQIQECSECHKGTHDKNVSKKCTRCHSQDNWKVKEFNHNMLIFLLDDVHSKIKCSDCHPKDTKNNLFRSVCNENCHMDTHKGQLGKSCGKCHSLNRWDDSGFNHNMFNFILAGPHAFTECKDCHKNKNYKDVPKDCYTCHKKEYNSSNHISKKFGKDCLGCHTLHDWYFKHLKTSIDCLLCHRKEIPSSHKDTFMRFSCANCHDFYVENWKFTHISVNTLPECILCHNKKVPKTHSKDEFGRYCEGCHDWNSTWKYNYFNIKKFPDIPGLHNSLSIKNCALCHPSDKFIDYDRMCITCHKKGKNCDTCHKKENIKEVHIDKKRQSCTFCHLMRKP